MYIPYFCNFIYFTVSIRYIIAFSWSHPLPGKSILLAQPICTREHTGFMLALTLRRHSKILLFQPSVVFYKSGEAGLP